MRTMAIQLFVVTVTIFGVLGGFEIYARWERGPTATPLSIVMREQTDFPQKEAYEADRTAVWRSGVGRYHDYFGWGWAEVETSTINYVQHPGHPYPSRLVPASLPVTSGSKEHPVVWLFGGSTMAEVTTTDTLSIANQTALELKRSGKPAVVVNFGMGGFQSTQELIKFTDLLRRVEPSLYPDVVVFYDGFNDIIMSIYHGPGNMAEDHHSILRAAFERRTSTLVAYRVSTWMAKYSVGWASYIHPRWVSKFYRYEYPKDISSVLRNYTANVTMIRAISDAMGIQPLFILQPLVFTKNPLTQFEQKALERVSPREREMGLAFYAGVRDYFTNAADFLDLTTVLDDIPGDQFYDIGHTNPLTGRILGSSLADRLQEMF